MATATAEPGTKGETDEERTARELEEQQERLDAEDAQVAGDGEIKDGQTGATSVKAPPEDLQVAGLTQLSMFDVGGKKALSSKVTIQGLSGLPVMGGKGFEKGTFIRGEFVARVEEVGLRDKMDRAANQAVDCIATAKAYATDVRIFGATAAALEDDAALAERVATAIQLLEADQVQDAINVLRPS